jgi:hypothetical protein
MYLGRSYKFSTLSFGTTGRYSIENVIELILQSALSATNLTCKQKRNFTPLFLLLVLAHNTMHIAIALISRPTEPAIPPVPRVGVVFFPSSPPLLILPSSSNQYNTIQYVNTPLLVCLTCASG